MAVGKDAAVVPDHSVPLPQIVLERSFYNENTLNKLNYDVACVDECPSSTKTFSRFLRLKFSTAHELICKIQSFSLAFEIGLKAMTDQFLARII